jgi:hypothetical protein
LEWYDSKFILKSLFLPERNIKFEVEDGIWIVEVTAKWEGTEKFSCFFLTFAKLKRKSVNIARALKMARVREEKNICKRLAAVK